MSYEIDLFPVHKLVWDNENREIHNYLNSLWADIVKKQYFKLDSLHPETREKKLETKILKTFKSIIEKPDNKGRTPLHLAVSLCHYESVTVLLNWGANTYSENNNKWSILHEAIGSGDPEIVGKILQYREYQRKLDAAKAIDKAYNEFILNKITDSPTESSKKPRHNNFYTEIKWEVSTWIPFVGALFAPNDTLKIWKFKNFIRLDFTLLGMENTRWIRGNQSNIIEVISEKELLFTKIDHNEKNTEVFHIHSDGDNLGTANINYENYEQTSTSIINSPLNESYKEELKSLKFSKDYVAKRLTEPTIYSYIEMDNIGIKLAEKSLFSNILIKDNTNLDVDGYKTKMYNFENVQLITRKRTEHLENGDEKKEKSNGFTNFFSKMTKNSLNPKNGDKTFENLTKNDNSNQIPFLNDPQLNNSINVQPRLKQLTQQEYFNSPNNSETDVGRPPVIEEKRQTVKFNIWIAEDHPLDLKTQISPLIDLASIANQNLKRLGNLLNSDQLPSGLPIKIDLPLFNLVTAKVSILNTKIYSDIEAENLNKTQEIFKIPEDYNKLRTNNKISASNKNSRNYKKQDISQNLRIGNSSNNTYTYTSNSIDTETQLEIAQLNEAIYESLTNNQNLPADNSSDVSENSGNHDLDRDTEQAIINSLRNQEDVDLETAIQLSLKDVEPY